MTYTPLLTVVAAIMTIGLTSCSDALMSPVDKDVKGAMAQSTQYLDNIRQFTPVSDALHGTVKRVDQTWVPVTRVESKRPADIETKLARTVTVNRNFATIQEAAQYVTSLTGVNAHVTMPSKGSSGSEGGTESTTETTSSATSSSSENTPETQTPIIYDGPLSGMLDQIAGQFGLFWDWEYNGINFFKTKTQTVRLATLPGDSSLTSSVASKSGGGSSSSSSGSESNMSSDSELEARVNFSEISVWKDIESSLKTMLSPDGKLAVTPATGVITVDDTPLVLERVTRFIDAQNVALSRQVVINVRVMAVDVSNDHQYGIDWGLAYNNVASNFGVSVDSVFAGTVTENPNSLTFNILSRGPWSNSEAIINALSMQGKVSQITSASIVTLNNQLAPIQVGKEISYIASSSTLAATDNSPPVTTYDTEKLKTGFSMNVLPHILDQQRLMLQYAGDISSLIRFTEVSDGDVTLRNPEVDTRSFLQRVMMNSGETLVVNGFEQFSMQGSTQGTGASRFMLLGGGAETKQLRRVIVVIIQPIISGT